MELLKIKKNRKSWLALPRKDRTAISCMSSRGTIKFQTVKTLICQSKRQTLPLPDMDMNVGFRKAKQNKNNRSGHLQEP